MDAEVMAQTQHLKNQRQNVTQVIRGITLTESHVGAKVWYIPREKRIELALDTVTNMAHAEPGCITHWNAYYVFVNFHGNTNVDGIACNASDLLLA